MDYNQTQLEIFQEVQSLRSAIDKVSGFITKFKSDYEVLEEKIELNSSDVARILGVSRASLARWQEANAIPSRYVSANCVVYPFKDLYIAARTGRATFGGLRRIEAMQRLNAYKDGIIKGYLGENKSEMLFEEL